MKDFKVNEYITLRLEDGKTNIYIKGKLVNQCKYILLAEKDISDISGLKSVDELAEHLNHSLDGVNPEIIDIPPETRFWVHCSNLQVWANTIMTLI